MLTLVEVTLLDLLPHRRRCLFRMFWKTELLGSTSRIAAKTKEHKFNLCGIHDVIPHSFSEGAGGARLPFNRSGIATRCVHGQEGE